MVMGTTKQYCLPKDLDASLKALQYELGRKGM